MFLDIHTHNSLSEANIKKIFNFSVSGFDVVESEAAFLKSGNSFSVGIHPWSIDSSRSEAQWERLVQWAHLPQAKCVGEAGLDKIRGAGFHEQELIFLKQIRLAEALKKPMIVHCVKAFNEILSIKKDIQPQIPMVIHGFNRKVDLMKTLQEKGFYVSFGHALLGQASVQAAFVEAKLSQVFFETDTSSVSIIDIYQTAAFLKNMRVEALKEQVNNNYTDILR
jgi:TatD DNase family protein